MSQETKTLTTSQISMPTTEPADKGEINTLVMQARQGSMPAFEGLYRQHVNSIYSLSFRMLANREKAEELTQEAFVRAWQKLHLFDGQSAFSTWLYRLATNVILSDLRKKRLVQTHDDFQDVLNQHKQTDWHPDKGRDLENAILNLPSGARQIFVLHDVEGHKHAEIADMLEIAEGTSKTQLHRARKLLREMMS